MMPYADGGGIPKFGSFKPKVSVNNSAQNAPSTPTTSTNRSHSKRTGSQGNEQDLPKRHAKDSRDHTDLRGRHHHRNSGPKQSSSTLQVAQDDPEDLNLFIIDKRGDTKNVEYGSLHRYSIPAYSRTGYGRVVGLPAEFKIDKAASSEKEAVISASGGQRDVRGERVLSAKFQANEPRAIRVIVPAASAVLEDEPHDFIPLRRPLERKRGSESPELQEDDIDYRSIGAQTDPARKPEDEDLEYVSDSSVIETEDTAAAKARHTTAALNKKVKDDPINVEAWLALIDHQSNNLHPGAQFAALDNAEKRAIADIKLSIYGRALKHITRGKSGHERLVLGSIEAGSLIWEGSKLAARWIEGLKHNPNSTLLWTKYLDFVQADRTNFRYEECKAAYIQCLKILDTASQNASDTEQASIATTRIYVLVRFTTFVREAGYEELAFATWQLLFEYHFFKPAVVLDKEAALSSLEGFWESDVPRIGDENAAGWDQFAPGENTCTRRLTTSTSTPLDPKQPFASFARCEAAHLETLLLPAATDDDSETADPFRFVMFSDLREVVEYLLDSLPKADLINGFLCFLSLPSIPETDSSSLSAILQADPFLSFGPTSQALAPPSIAALCSDTHRVWGEKCTTFSLFQDAFTRFQVSAAGGKEGDDFVLRFVNQVLAKLISLQFGNELLMEYHLAFKLSCFPDEVSKVAKRYLKANASNLRLYNAYALTESRLDRLSKAIDVWSMALKLVSSLTEEARDNAILVWHSWVLTLVHMDHADQALGCLLSMPHSDDGDGATIAIRSSDVTAGQRLKASRHLEQGFEHMRFKRKPAYAILYTDCLAWLSYLVDGDVLNSSLQIYEGFSAILRSSDDFQALELLHQARAKMLQLHMGKRRPYKPAMLRAELAKSIQLFPNNSLFLDIHVQVGAQFRLDDRLRDVVRSDITDSASLSLARWSFTITDEMRRYSIQNAASTQNSVRSLFTAALLSMDSKVKHSPALWRLWFRFETAHIQEYPEQMPKDSNEALRRVKDVFYSGLRHLPWYKPWIIMGLGYFSSIAGMKVIELRQVYDVLTERELRIRVEGIESLC